MHFGSNHNKPKLQQNTVTNKNNDTLFSPPPLRSTFTLLHQNHDCSSRHPLSNSKAQQPIRNPEVRILHDPQYRPVSSESPRIRRHRAETHRRQRRRFQLRLSPFGDRVVVPVFLGGCVGWSGGEWFVEECVDDDGER